MTQEELFTKLANHFDDRIAQSHGTIHSDLRRDILSVKEDLRVMQIDVTEAKRFGEQAKTFIEDAKPALDTFKAIRGTSRVMGIIAVALATIAAGLVGYDEIIKHFK